MPTYQQMGHHGENLLDDSSLTGYAGALLSPVDYTESEVVAQISRLHVPDQFEFIFDPQLYYPQTKREILRKWSYFPGDVDTADQSSVEWWKSLVAKVVAVGRRLGAQSICSPAIVPRAYSDDYFDVLVQAGQILADASNGFTPVQTLLVSLPELADRKRTLSIASILSRTKCPNIYLIFLSDREPRREHDDAAALTGAMLLIHLLERADLRVTVGFSSSDIILWKAAGASACATGKYFNLRRLTKSRFEEPSGGGGGQLPYWFEESLFAYLRETDLLRTRAENLISETSVRSPLSAPIFEILDRGKGEAWLALSWRHYMWWFADFENRIARGEADPRSLLQRAEDNWLALQDRDVLFEEPRNNSSWIRPWRQALSDFGKATI